MKFAVTVLFSLMLASCASTDFMKTGNKSFSALPKNCDFTIFTTHPKQAFDEVGLVEFGEAPKRLANAKKKAAPYVCSSGGNGLLIWEADGFGQYRKATVIRFSDI